MHRRDYTVHRDSFMLDVHLTHMHLHVFYTSKKTQAKTILQLIEHKEPLCLGQVQVS